MAFWQRPSYLHTLRVALSRLLSSSPLLVPALCLIAGIYAGYQLAPGSFVYSVPAVGLLTACVLVSISRPVQVPITLAPLRHTLLLWLLMGCLGVLRSAQVNHNNMRAAAQLTTTSEDEVFALGHVSAVQQPGRFVLRVRRLYADTTIVALQGNVQVMLPEQTANPIAGQHLVVRGFLQVPAGKRNPGAFDYRAYLNHQNISHLFYANALFKLPAASSLKLVDMVSPLRQHVTHVIENYVQDASVRAVLFALLLGDTSTLSNETQHAFQQTGLMHLLAVSGLHVMLVGMVVYACLQPVCLRLGFSWRAMMFIRLCVVTLLLFTYLLLTWAKPPVVRAVLMAALMMGGQQLQRQTASVNLLSIAAILLLLYHPANVFSAGFQLSFAAVLGIVLLVPPLKALLPATWVHTPTRRFFTDGILVSIGATLGTFPVLLYHFSTVPLGGIVLNLLALPLTAAVLSGGFCMLLLAAIWAPLGIPLGAAVTFLGQTLLWVVSKGALFPVTFSPGTPNSGTLVFLTLGLLMLPGLFDSSRRWRHVLVLVLLANAQLWTSTIRGAHRPVLTVVFFDVQHGDACLVVFPNRKTMLVDTGGFIGEVPAAERAILPYLRMKGIKALDTVVLSHAHQDHAGGLPALLATLPVHRVVTAPDLSYSRYVPSSVNHHTVLAGDTLALDSSVKIRFLAPGPALNVHPNPNTRSLTFQLQYGKTHMLFTGDATILSEQFLLQYFPVFLRSDVVKVPHHGSATSSSQALVDAAIQDSHRFSTALISTGSARRYGLPHAAVVARWKNAGASIHQTATAGALVLSSDGTTIQQWNY